MSKISRRDLFKATLAAGLGVTLRCTRAALTLAGGNIVYDTGIAR